jgi:hypothetical protein
MNTQLRHRSCSNPDALLHSAGKLEPISVILIGKKSNAHTVIRGFSAFEINADVLVTSLRSQGISVMGE